MSSRPLAVGSSQQCDSQQHHLCQQAGCRCMCHYPAKNLIQKTDPPLTEEAPPEATIVCPKCNAPPKANDKFCRWDGSKLIAAGYCGACQAVTLPGDQFCWSCGANVRG